MGRCLQLSSIHDEANVLSLSDSLKRYAGDERASGLKWEGWAIGWAGEALKRVLGSLAVVQPYKPNAGPITQLKHMEHLDI